MKTINIAPFIDELNVFDDPEYCNDINDRCSYFDDEWCVCCLHVKDEQPIELEWVQIEAPLFYVSIVKCPQCKEAYRKAIEAHKAHCADWNCEICGPLVGEK